MGIAKGVECIPSSSRDGTATAALWACSTARAKPRPAYHALAAMVKTFGQHPRYLGWLLLNDRCPAFVFQGSQGTILAAWGGPGTPDVFEDWPGGASSIR